MWDFHSISVCVHFREHLIGWNFAHTPIWLISPVNKCVYLIIKFFFSTLRSTLAYTWPWSLKFSNFVFFDVREKKKHCCLVNLKNIQLVQLGPATAAKRLDRKFMFYFSITINEHLALTPQWQYWKFSLFRLSPPSHYMCGKVFQQWPARPEIE